MSELLTTGQLIDQLKVGQKARAFTPDGNEIPRMKVVKNDAHSIMVVEPWEVLRANGFTLGTKWKLEPQYVTFEEAMRTLKDAGKVYFHDEDWKGRIFYDQWIEDSEVHGYTFAQLINGKWTIED